MGSRTQAPKCRVRVPRLRFTTTRGVGWHVCYRDPTTKIPKKHRFGITAPTAEAEAQARNLYIAWAVEHFGPDIQIPAIQTPTERTNTPLEPQSLSVSLLTQSSTRKGAQPLTGSLIEIASSLIESERVRTRKEGDPRRRGTIDPRVFSDRKKQIHDFLAFLNSRHGTRAVAKIRLADLQMDDVESYNRHIVSLGYSSSQVNKRMQIVRAIIDRAGRPEHGQQVLMWNWNSRDKAHGVPATERILPTKDQLIRLLDATDLRGKTMIWLGIGLGFGASDLAAIHVGQIDKDAYDLRRGKTDIERYGETPPLVWAFVAAYQKAEKRATGDLLFRTKNGEPLVHGPTNAVVQWWDKLRIKVIETRQKEIMEQGREPEKPEIIDGFYTLRHLGATEFGSRPGTSIGNVKRWLGHTASSNVADLYMRPVRPEYREVIEWIRKRLASRVIEEY